MIKANIGIISSSKQTSVTPPFTGRTFYVTSAGSNSNSGTGTTAGLAWQTMAKVSSYMNNFLPGDRILLNKGETFFGVVNWTKDGTPSSPITISSYGSGADPIWTSSANPTTYIMNFNGAEYVNVNGINFTDTTMDPNNRFIVSRIKYAIQFNNANNNIIANSNISLVGVGINMIGDNNIMSGCTVTNMRMTRNTPGGVDDYGANPVVIAGNSNKIFKNTFTECWASSYDFAWDGGAIEFFDVGGGTDNNEITYNTFYHCLGWCEAGSDQAGATCYNNLFAYNKIINSLGIALHINDAFAVDVQNLKIWNNTIISNDTFFETSGFSDTILIWADSAPASGAIDMRNNIIYLRNGFDVSQSGRFNGPQLLHQNNVYNLGAGSTLNFTIHPSETATTINNWVNVSDPSAANWDLHLVSTAPARNFGQTLTGLTVDFDGVPIGSPPDAGAYEFV